VQDIQDRGDAAVPDIGTMYRALARLAETGLIAAARGVNAIDQRRINYRVTTLGLRVAQAEAQRLEALARAARVGGLLPKKAT
jgi:DNA-binding PadR family transcriptional regulator